MSASDLAIENGGNGSWLWFFFRFDRRPLRADASSALKVELWQERSTESCPRLIRRSAGESLGLSTREVIFEV